MPAERLCGDPADVGSRHRDGPAVRADESGQQCGERGFAGAAGAGQRDDAAGLQGRDTPSSTGPWSRCTVTSRISTVLPVRRRTRTVELSPARASTCRHAAVAVADRPNVRYGPIVPPKPPEKQPCLAPSSGAWHMARRFEQDHCHDESKECFLCYWCCLGLRIIFPT